MTNMKVTVCLLTFSSFCVLQAHYMDYNELEYMGVSCPVRDSCAFMRNRTFFESNCECDSRCGFYDNCCIDYQQTIQYVPSPHGMTNGTCMTFAGQDNVGVFAVDKCRRDFSGPAEVRSKCEHPSSMSDPFVAAPATNALSNVTFRNMYCAACNGVPSQNLTPWATNVQCENLLPNGSNGYIMQNLEYRSATDQWGISHWNGSVTVFSQCDLVFYLPQLLVRKVRLCRANVVSTCPRSWRRQSIRQKCQSYTAVVAFSTTVFRNPHCAVCNGVGLDRLTCEYGIFSKNRQPMSFAMLLDINQSDGPTVGLSLRASEICPTNAKYDPFSKKCRNLICALPGFKLVNGRCVRN